MKNKFGLRKLSKDERDFKLGNVFDLPKLEELPDEFILGEPIIHNQGDTDYCSAYATCGMSEFQEEVELYPPYSFALSKEISGDADEWGQDLRTALKSHTNYGAIEKGLTDINGRKLSDYPDLLSEAQKHLKKSFFNVSGGYDHFDIIRASMWHFRAKKQGVALGVLWSWDLSEKQLTGTVEAGFGHALYCIGWKGDYLIVVNSYGKEAGENGRHYLHRDTVNHFVKQYGAFMMVDMPKEEAKELNTRGEWRNAGFFGKILIFLKRLWK